MHTYLPLTYIHTYLVICLPIYVPIHLPTTYLPTYLRTHLFFPRNLPPKYILNSPVWDLCLSGLKIRFETVNDVRKPVVNVDDSKSLSLLYYVDETT